MIDWIGLGRGLWISNVCVDQWVSLDVQPDDHQTRSRPVQPRDFAARPDVETIDLVSQRTCRASRENRIAVGGIDLSSPEDASAGAQLQAGDVGNLPHQPGRGVDQPQASLDALEGLHDVDALGLVVKDGGLEVETTSTLAKGTILACEHVNHVDVEDTLISQLCVGVVSAVRRDGLPADREPTGEGAIEIAASFSAEIDRHRGGWKSDESTLVGNATKRGRERNWKPARERDPAQWEVAGNRRLRLSRAEAQHGAGAALNGGLPALCAGDRQHKHDHQPADHTNETDSRP